MKVDDDMLKDMDFNDLIMSMPFQVSIIVFVPTEE